MGAFRTLGLTFLLFAISFPYLGSHVSNIGIAPQFETNGLADLELNHLVIWDGFRPEAEQKEARMETITRTTVGKTGTGATIPSVASMVKADASAAVDARYDYGRFPTLAGHIAGVLGTQTRSRPGTVPISISNFQSMRNTLKTRKVTMEKARYVYTETPDNTPAPTGTPGQPSKEQALEDFDLAQEVVDSMDSLAFQGQNSERVAAVFLSWGLIAALAAATIEALQYTGHIKLGNVWRVPMLVMFATLLFFMSSLVLIGVEDAVRQMYNDLWCVYPERHITSDQFHPLLAGDTSDRCQVSFTPNLQHVTIFMAFTFAILSFFMFTIAKVKQEWADSDKDTTA